MTSPDPSRPPVLCAIGDLARSEMALRAAADIALALGRRLHIVSVWIQGGSRTAESHARRTLDLAAAVVGEATAHLECDSDVVLGVARVADRLDAGLVVIGARPANTFIRHLAGTNALDLLDRASWPLLIVPQSASWPPRRIVVGDDGGDAARSAAVLAAELAEALELPITLIEATDRIVDRPPRRGDQAGRGLRRSLSELRERAHELGGEGEVSVHASLRLRDARHALLQEAAAGGAPLLVTGHRTVLQLLESGDASVAETLTEAAVAPLLVYPNAALDRDYWRQMPASDTEA